MENKTLNCNVYLLLGGGCCNGNVKDMLEAEIEARLDFRSIKKAKLLFVLFGKDEIDWEKTVIKYRDSIFLKLFREEKISVSIANRNRETLKKQLTNSDIIFFCGGSELLLKEHLKEEIIPLHNKIIIGVSAGTNILSKYYFSNDRQSIENGLGILPIKMICHFTPEKISKVIALSSVGGSYPTFPIKENEYIVWEKK